LLLLLQRLHVNLDELIPGAADRIGGASKNKSCRSRNNDAE
jgi:hypothetical protein